MDFSHYKLNDLAELDELAEKYGPKFEPFLRKVYKCLTELKEGESFDIEANVCAENRELFIKIGCSYILEESQNRGTFDSWIEASNDYSHFRRMPSCHPVVFKKKRTLSQLKTT